jgi:hypothetical protein
MVLLIFVLARYSALSQVERYAFTTSAPPSQLTSARSFGGCMLTSIRSFGGCKTSSTTSSSRSKWLWQRGTPS